LGAGAPSERRVGKNMQFSANKSQYIRNGARYDQGYYDGLIGTKIIDLIAR